MSPATLSGNKKRWPANALNPVRWIKRQTALLALFYLFSFFFSIQFSSGAISLGFYQSKSAGKTEAKLISATCCGKSVRKRPPTVNKK